VHLSVQAVHVSMQKHECMCVYTHTHTNAQVHVSVQANLCMRVYLCVYVHMYAYTGTHARVNVCTCVRVYTCTTRSCVPGLGGKTAIYRIRDKIWYLISCIAVHVW